MKEREIKMIETIFNKFREIEGIEKGQISEMLGTEGVFSVLINRRWKYEKNIPNTDLEKVVRSEAGNLIGMFIADTFQKPVFMNSTGVPFKEWDLTMKELLENLEKAQTANIRRIIA